jgi:hypothetical protein
LCARWWRKFIIVMPIPQLNRSFPDRFDRVLVESTILDISEQKVQITLSAGIAIFPIRDLT